MDEIEFVRVLIFIMGIFLGGFLLDPGIMGWVIWAFCILDF